MGKYYCDYCDIYLTHDSMNARKAHNSGRNHVANVRDYFAGLGGNQAQTLIDQIIQQHESGGRNQMMMAPSMRMGAGFMNPLATGPGYPPLSQPPPGQSPFFYPPATGAPPFRPPFPPSASPSAPGMPGAGPPPGMPPFRPPLFPSNNASPGPGGPQASPMGFRPPPGFPGALPQGPPSFVPALAQDLGQIRP
ncbi:uncharacterized protein L203_102931 [Cryptococcus depauperatus CBS 7841]|uniref:U1 small nuclear ribonucleoprotein C n=1 Tax=Cryptococcus depauperatus CBS 7841 TaxID=1295531 RepID=A0A1E3IQ08_9TREE|nr:U1 small nuclear ribonucleoprotein C [Cryptococcus depauperatus CBS 7841]